MRQKKNKTNRWKKFTMLTLTAAMLIPAAPGAVYGASEQAVVEENPNEEEFFENIASVSGDTGNEAENEHIHSWSYNKASVSAQEVTAGCPDSECLLSGNQVRLTLHTEQGPEHKVSVLADGEALTHTDERKISYEIKYYKDDQEVGTEENPPIEPGVYKVRAAFGDETGVYLETDYIIEAPENVTEKPSDAKVEMKGYAYGDTEAKAPSLSGEEGEIEKIEYCYYKGDEEQTVFGDFNPKSLNVGTYNVLAKYTLSSEEDCVYVTSKTEFEVTKGEYKGLKVIMEAYGLNCREDKRPQPKLNEKLEETPQPEVTYYYSTKNKNTGGTIWDDKKAKEGTYYMYAAIAKTDNYKKSYTTPAVKFKVYADHNWSGLPKTPTSEEQTKEITCICCEETKTMIFPKKTISVKMGKTAKLVSKNTGCTFTTSTKGKYFTLDSAQGKITMKKDAAYYASVKKSIPVKVEACGKTYTMTVKPKIPAPKVKIDINKITRGKVWGYRFKFKYNFPKADDITVQMVEGSTANIEKELRKYVSTPYTTRNSYIDLTNSFLQEKLHYKVQFKITANYGRNKSQPTIIKLTGTKTGKAKYKWTQERIK